MTEAELRELLSEETLAWAEREPADIVADLAAPRKYARGEGDRWHEFEVTLLEATHEFIHVKTSIHDGSLVWSLAPVTTSFLIYRDGRSQLCVRNPTTRDYVVFDEYGVFYVYSNAPAFRQVFLACGFEERHELLIADGGCWRSQPPDGRRFEAEFVRLLRLKPIPPPGTAHPSNTVH